MKTFGNKMQCKRESRLIGYRPDRSSVTKRKYCPTILIQIIVKTIYNLRFTRYNVTDRIGALRMNFNLIHLYTSDVINVDYRKTLSFNVWNIIYSYKIHLRRRNSMKRTCNFVTILMTAIQSWKSWSWVISMIETHIDIYLLVLRSLFITLLVCLYCTISTFVLYDFRQLWIIFFIIIFTLGS